MFNEWEIGYLLEGLAHGPTPAVAGLDDELRTLKKDNYRDRLEAFRRSRLSLTESGGLRPSRSATSISNWQVVHGGPLARRRLRTGLSCRNKT
jgi:hypothetical protein